MSASTGKSPESEPTLQPTRSRRGLWAAVAVVVIVVIIVASGAMTNWFGLTSQSKPVVQLNGAGSTFVFPLMQTWRTQYYNTTGHGVQVNYQGVGSGAGITSIIQKNVDFGATDAPLNTTQHTQNPALLTIPESIGAVTISYNVVGIPAHINITGEIIANIYLGIITNWNDANLSAINPGVTFPNLAIRLFYRADASGTSYTFTDYLSKVSTQWASQVGVSKSPNWPAGSGQQGNQGVAGAIQQNSGGFGYVELAYALENNMHYAKVKNQAGAYILPSLNATAAAAAGASSSLPAGNGDWAHVSITNAPGTDSYPIATFTYLLVYNELNTYGSPMTQERAQALVSFLWWIIHDGQNAASTLQYVPLPNAVVTLDETTIHSITFNGQALTTP